MAPGTSFCQQKFIWTPEALHHFSTKLWKWLCLRCLRSYPPIHQVPRSPPFECHQVQRCPACSPSLHAYGNINWLKLGRSLPLDDLPYTAKCYCVTEVLHTSCPASQSSSPKLLSSVYPPSGTSVGGRRVGGSIRLGSYWREWKWLQLEIEVLQLKWRRTTVHKAGKYKWNILKSVVPIF